MTKKVVQNAKEEKPKSEPSPSPEPVQVASKEEAPTASNKGVSKLIEIPQVDEDTRKMLAKAGFSWNSFVAAFEKINIWAESVDGRFNVLVNALGKMPTNEGVAKEVIEKLQAVAEKQRVELAEKMRNAAPSDSKKEGLSITDIAKLAKEFGGGGGDSDSFFAQMGKAWMQRKMASDDFGEFMSKEMFKRVFPDAIAAYEQEIVKRAKEEAAKKTGA